jgi:predicted aspartyl protease
VTEGRLAVTLAPRDAEAYQTLGTIFERMHRYEEAAEALASYIRLLPNKDKSVSALRSRAEVRFLRSFGAKTPFAMDPGAERQIYSVPFRLVRQKVVVRARVNGGPEQDFVVDTGAEQTVLSRPTADRLRIRPIAYAPTAGVGDRGVQDLAVARLDSLQVGSLTLRNVPCLIRGSRPRGLPTTVGESLSPVALGFSMTIDYRGRRIIFGKHLPPEAADLELPLRLHRLVLVRGTIDGAQPRSFVIDTGGEVISISRATAASLGRPEPARKIRLRVFGASGWDRDAFLMPGVNLEFGPIRYTKIPVVVLNLRMPSALLGFQVGGIVGYKFLSKYRVDIDLERSVLRLKGA